MIETQDREHEARYKHRWYGKYRAFVRDNNDPERLGRCRLEIPAVLGQGRENWSDWASPSFPYGGNQDTGMFLIPEEGASVWAEFEAEGKPNARMGDAAACGARIVTGSPDTHVN